MTMLEPGKCDLATIDYYEKNLNTGERYLGVNVRVVAVDAAKGTVDLEAHDLNDKQVLATLPWGDELLMWAPCPSTLPSQAQHQAPGPVPSVGAYGVLYLHLKVIGAHGLQTTTPKWPSKY